MDGRPSRARAQTIKQYYKSLKDEVKHIPGKAQAAVHAKVKQQYNDLRDYESLNPAESYLLDEFLLQVEKIWKGDYDNFDFTPTKTETKNKKRQHTFKNWFKFRIEKEGFGDFRGDNLWKRREAWNGALKMYMETGIPPGDVERFALERDEVAREDWRRMFGDWEEKEDIELVAREDRDTTETF